MIRASSLVLQLVILMVLLNGASCTAAESDSAKRLDKPIIGINLDVSGKSPVEYSVQAPYVEAISKAGGIPVLLPPLDHENLETVMRSLDGVMMIGGDDYPPSSYGQKAHNSVVPMAQQRSEFDLLLLQQVLKQRAMPFLGICAGCQALNIAAGGTLVQDIPTHNPDSKIKHASPKGWQVGFNKHTVSFKSGSKLKEVFERMQVEVLTSHHQCVDKTGEGLEVAATSPDGIVEAIEWKDSRFVVGVQWHPERDFKRNRQLFERFVEECRAYNQTKNQAATGR